jgi:hypothetical protein
MEYLNTISAFLQANQLLLISALFIFSYFAKRFIDYKAAQPQHDMWDRVKPGSDLLYSLVHRGVEYLAKSKGLDSATKLLEYAKQLEKFEGSWKLDKQKAIKELSAWFLSMEAKAISANPSIGPDDPAQ